MDYDTCSSLMTPAAVKKAHWNCHGVCNCHCKFCYGMFAGHLALDSSSGMTLINNVALGGVEELVFGGGDPLQRKDLLELVTHAAFDRRLTVEIQTNAQLLTAARLNPLHPWVHRWGLSLDSSDEDVHDLVRGRPGNYRKVIGAANMFTEMNVRWNLRTVVAKPTLSSVCKIGDWLNDIGFVGTWYLLQYTPLGDEMRNRDRFEITAHEFAETVSAVVERFAGTLFSTVPVPDADRRGIYFLMAPDGAVYNHPSPGEPYAIVGNILTDCFEELVQRLTIDFSRHYDRYGTPAEGAPVGVTGTLVRLSMGK